MELLWCSHMEGWGGTRMWKRPPGAVCDDSGEWFSGKIRHCLLSTYSKHPLMRLKCLPACSLELPRGLFKMLSVSIISYIHSLQSQNWMWITLSWTYQYILSLTVLLNGVAFSNISHSLSCFEQCTFYHSLHHHYHCHWKSIIDGTACYKITVTWYSLYLHWGALLNIKAKYTLPSALADNWALGFIFSHTHLHYVGLHNVYMVGHPLFLILN